MNVHRCRCVACGAETDAAALSASYAWDMVGGELYHHCPGLRPGVFSRAELVLEPMGRDDVEKVNRWERQRREVPE